MWKYFGYHPDPHPPPILSLHVVPKDISWCAMVRHQEILVAHGEMTRRYLLVTHWLKRWGWGSNSYISANITIRFLSNISWTDPTNLKFFWLTKSQQEISCCLTVAHHEISLGTTRSDKIGGGGGRVLAKIFSDWLGLFNLYYWETL